VATVVENHLSQIASQGYTVLEGVIEPDLVDAMTADLVRLEKALGTVPADNLFEGLHTTRIYNLLAHGELYQRIPVHPKVLEVVEQVLDPGLLISSLSSVAIGPGESAQMLHADDQMIPLPRPHPQIICNTMWALTDFTEENGATRIVPGTHLADQPPDPFQPHETVAAEMSKGSVLVFVGSLWHGGGANRTNERRVGIAMNYCAGFLRQQENQQLGLRRDLVATFPQRLQELVGYSVYNGLIGHIDKNHPSVVLGSSERADMIWDQVRAETVHRWSGGRTPVSLGSRADSRGSPSLERDDRRKIPRSTSRSLGSASRIRTSTT
jgi:ectoine hydroxylase-related dioxygenase (phytanoyl-CoA dioxygenase family)